MTFGEKLQTLRSRAGLSQDTLAELLDVSRQAVSKWERDEAMPEAEKLVRISDCFQVTIDSLLRPDREPEAPTPPGRRALLRSGLSGWYARRGWLLGVPAALAGGWGLLRLTASWSSIAQMILEGGISGAQGVAWLLFMCKQQAGEASALLLAGILWTLLGRRRSGSLRWHHLGWGLVIWGAIDLLVQCAIVTLLGLTGTPGSAGSELTEQMGLLWQGMGPQAVCGGGVVLMGLAIALGGRRLDRPVPRQNP